MAKPRKLKIHCKHGHPLHSKTIRAYVVTRKRKDGTTYQTTQRQCRVCEAVWQRERRRNKSVCNDVAAAP